MMRRSRYGRRLLRPNPLALLTAPTVIDSALTAQKETEGTASYVAALAASGAAGLTLLSWVGVKTSLFAGPVTGNLGNSHTQVFSQDYPAPYSVYSLRGFRSYAVAGGGSPHSVTGSKDASTAEEATIGLLALSGGTITAAPAAVVRAAAGAGATHTSAEVTVAAGSALLVAVASGTGDVNATAPTQTWPGTWTVHRSVAYSAAQAPNGHIPLYIATRSVSAGTYSVGVQTAIDEGLLMWICAVQVQG